MTPRPAALHSIRMSWITRILGLEPSPVVAWSLRGEMPTGLMPPARSAFSGPHDAVTLVPVFRALQVITTAATQLPVTVERGGVVLDDRDVPALVRRPGVAFDRAEWIEQAVMSLALSGDLYVLNRNDADLLILPAREVSVHEHERTGLRTYTWRDRRYTSDEIHHRRYLSVPGRLTGLGPIEAARSDLAAAIETRDYAANWFSSSGEPSGILATSKELTADQARAYRSQWNEAAAATSADNPTRVRVIGGDLKYSSLHLKPSDAQWLESRQFSTLEMARLFGVPGSLLLAAPEGNVQSYANVEQEWIAFTRFTLMNYLVKIESILTAITARGQRVKFNVEGLLRADTSSRYSAYGSALAAGWLTRDEVRAREGYAPLTPAQLALEGTTHHANS